MRFVVLLVSLIILGGQANAQVGAAKAPAARAPTAQASAAQGTTAQQNGADLVIQQARDGLRAAAAGLNSRTLSDSDIQARLSAIPPIQAKLVDLLATLEPRQQDLQARVAELGPPPPKGAMEVAQTAQTRDGLTRRLATITGNVASVRLLALTADQLDAKLSDRLRENFSARLWTRTRSVLAPSLWYDFALALPGDLARLSEAVRAEAAKVAASSHPVSDAAIVCLAILGALALVWPAAVLLNRVAYTRAARTEAPPRLRRVSLALWRVLVATLTPLLAGLLLRGALVQIDAMTPEFDELTSLLVRVTAFAAFLAGLGRALLAPRRPEQRLAPVPDSMVTRLAPFPVLIGVTAALSTFVTGLNTILDASVASRIASDCLTVLVELAAVGGALMAMGEARVARQALAAETAAPAESASSRLPWILATLAAWIALTGALIAVLVGYLALAIFIVKETVWIAAVLGLLALMLNLVDDLFPALLSPKTRLGSALQTAVGLSHSAVEQLGVLLSGIARLALLFLAWAAVLLPFGANAGNVFRRFNATDFVWRLGQVSITPGAVLEAVALFLAGLFITRAVRRWLEVRYLPKTDLDLGMRTSLAAGVTYLGALIAALATFTYLGLSVAQIALFASALSVGIGFGLQAIIGNFVSGLILLAERPVRVGDWVAIGDLEGDVRKISIRATEIEMLDRSRLIVPNSDLISKTVRNVTHAGALGRVRIVLKVSDEADAEQVRQILLTQVQRHPKVLREPPAAVYLTDVRDGAIEFTAFAYLASPRQVYAARSDLLLKILPELKAAGIALANPATLVNVDVTERPLEPKPTED